MTFLEAFERAKRRMEYIRDDPKTLAMANHAWREIKQVHRQYTELCELFPAKCQELNRDAIGVCHEYFIIIKRAYETPSEQSK